MEYKKYYLSDLLKIKNGKDHSSLSEGSFPVYGSGGVMRYVSCYLYDGVSILLPRKGNIKNIQYVDGKFWTVDTTFYTDINKEIVNPYYLFRYLQGLKLHNFDTGTSIPSMTSKLYNKVRVLLPDKTYQDSVAIFIKQYDNLIENNNNRIKLLEQIAQEIYKEMFVRNQSENCKIKISELGVILESGRRPKGGIDSSLLEGIPSLGAESINSLGEFDYSSVKMIPYEFYKTMKTGVFKNGDILIYKDGAYIGKTTMFKNNFPFESFVVNEHVFLMRATNEKYQNYLYFTLNQKCYFDLMQILNRNAAQPGLTKPDVLSIKINNPSDEKIETFNSLANPILDEIFILAHQNKNLINQRDLLLPRLMSGKLEVK